MESAMGSFHHGAFGPWDGGDDRSYDGKRELRNPLLVLPFPWTHMECQMAHISPVFSFPCQEGWGLSEMGKKAVMFDYKTYSSVMQHTQSKGIRKSHLNVCAHWCGLEGLSPPRPQRSRPGKTGCNITELEYKNTTRDTICGNVMEWNCACALCGYQCSRHADRTVAWLWNSDGWPSRSRVVIRPWSWEDNYISWKVIRVSSICECMLTPQWLTRWVYRVLMLVFIVLINIIAVEENQCIAVF